ncbi:MAG: Electron transport complex subunit RsxB [Proteobacteria bacterium]|nr:MAG: Electron transport complex subunit RsxB [Pseudomonadota bacterium]|tara:strand:- start:294 stop:806 length:513 start_codon:yes stop_codon:yes gene_type:complete
MIYLLLLIIAIAILLLFAEKFLAVEEDAIVEKINDLLPQTQCGQCDYPGCKPYAKAIANGEVDINKCQPGGERVIKELAELLGKEAKAPAKEQKSPQVVVIDEDKCIGCTKCIQVCPPDCIIGAVKKMHTVVEKDCTGCELCIEVCPVDCIDIVKLKQQFKYSKVKVNID